MNSPHFSLKNKIAKGASELEKQRRCRLARPEEEGLGQGPYLSCGGQETKTQELLSQNRGATLSSVASSLSLRLHLAHGDGRHPLGLDLDLSLSLQRSMRKFT